MELSISRNGGQYQFWHVDCSVNRRANPMHTPKNLPNNVKEFECVACGKRGQVTMPIIMVGRGTLI